MRWATRGRPCVSAVGGPPIPDLLIGLRYAVFDLHKDVENALELLPHHEREGAKTEFTVFAIFNKLKPKHGSLSPDLP
jgi:hypothetical protein